MTAVDQGWNFRGSSGYVADSTDESFVLGTEIYPTTRDGYDIGLDVAQPGLDQSTSVDHRLAGLISVSNASLREFRIDLPRAGQYKLTLASGHPTGAAGNPYITILDDDEVRIQLRDPLGGVANASFMDMLGAEYAVADWSTGNGIDYVAFGSAICIVRIGDNSAVGGVTNLSHFALEELGDLNLLDEIGGRLDDQGIASSSGDDGWVLVKSQLPDSSHLQHQVVALIETPGELGDGRNELDKPHFQVLVRGAPVAQVSCSYALAQMKASEIKRDLHALGPVHLRGRYYPAIWALQDPFLLQFDKSDRPILAMNFRAYRSRT